MRILHFGPSAIPVDYPLGGAVQRRMLALARAQADAGHEVLVVSPESGGPVRFEESRPGCSILRVACRSRRPWRDVELLLRTRWILRRRRFDVLHAHAAPFAALIRGLAASSLLTFDFFRFAGAQHKLGRSGYRRLLRRFTRLVAVSEFCRDEFRRFYGLTDPVEVVYNGVDRECFAPSLSDAAAARARHHVPSEALLFLFAGRFCEQKGGDLLLAAFAQVVEQRPDARLLLVGPVGRFGADGTPELGAVGNDPRLIWAGARPDVELVQAMNAADVALLPTRRDEMFGMAALEALACGTPVVASRLGGIPEVVSEQTGWFFSPGDAHELAERMVQAGEDSERRHRAALARSSTERFSWSTIEADFAAVYAGARTS